MTSKNDQDDLKIVLQAMECHSCDAELERVGVSSGSVLTELERVGVSSFGKCPECGRKMLFSEWRKLQEEI